MSSAEFTKTIAAYSAGTTVPTILDKHPFLALNPIRYRSPGAAVVYGVDRPAASDTSRVITFTGDGTTTVYDEDDFALLASAHDDATSLAVADYLRVVVLVNSAPLARIVSGGTPTGVQFDVDTDAGKLTITFGTAPADGARVQIFINAATDIVQINSGALTANLAVQDLAYGFMVSGTAAVNLEQTVG